MKTQSGINKNKSRTTLNATYVTLFLDTKEIYKQKNLTAKKRKQPLSYDVSSRKYSLPAQFVRTARNGAIIYKGI